MMSIAIIVFFAGIAYAALTGHEPDTFLRRYVQDSILTELEQDGTLRECMLDSASIECQREKCRKAHNILRNLHENTPPLERDETLENVAQAYAEKLMRNNRKPLKKEDHDPRNKVKGWGENLSQGSKQTCVKATYNWYNEEEFYDYEKGGRKLGISEKEAIGHFTQLVWKGSTKIGFGIASNGAGDTWIVAKYAPPGNVIHWDPKNPRKLYIENVEKRKSGVSTPALHVLDPDECKNTYPENACTWFANNDQYTCNNSGVRNVCYKLCTGC